MYQICNICCLFIKFSSLDFLAASSDGIQVIQHMLALNIELRIIIEF